MSTSAEHPLEALYQARDALQAAVISVQQQTSECVSDELCCYAGVNTAIFYEFRTLLGLLAGKLDPSRPEVHTAQAEMDEILVMLDQVVSYIEQHQPTIADLRSQ